MNTPITYTITHRGNCVFITGSVPVEALNTLINLVPEYSVMSPDTARMFGATFAFGEEAELKALREAQAPAVMRETLARHQGLNEAAANWLASGERGVSSNTIFEALTGINATSGHRSHPYDPSDFRRCQLLLEQVPELQEQFHRMADVSPAWRNLVAAWPKIVAALDKEVPSWRDGKTGKSASEAYDLIQSAIGRYF